MKKRVAERAPHWQGGKRHIGGYVYIYSPRHPNNTQGYVCEHRLKMERKLGRRLRPSEAIHHINGCKDDNHMSNLKVFKSRGIHSRKEHIKRYSDGRFR